MSKTVDEIERDIQQLTPEELKRFRAWYEEFDADSWDKQIEKDAVEGRLDGLAAAALREHESGRSRKL